MAKTVIPRALSNICRHRGALLAEGRGHGHRLVCRYYHWCYDLEGKLAGTPHGKAQGL